MELSRDPAPGPFLVLLYQNDLPLALCISKSNYFCQVRSIESLSLRRARCRPAILATQTAEAEKSKVKSILALQYLLKSI